MKVTRTRLKQIVKEELIKEAGRTLKQVGREKRSAAGMPSHSRYSEDPFTPIMDDFEKLLDKHNVQDPMAVLAELKDRWETMLADQEEADQAEGYI
jgi:hypothetical protein